MYLEAFPDMNPRFFPATEDYGHYEELPGEPGEHLFPEHPLEPDSFSEAGPPGRPKPGAGVPDFLPSAQRALYLRIQQKQQEEEERARRLAESSKQDRENEEGMCPPQGQGLSLTGAGTPHHCAGDRWGTPRSGFAPERSLWPGRTPAPGCEVRLGLLHVQVRAVLLCLGGQETPQFHLGGRRAGPWKIQQLIRFTYCTLTEEAVGRCLQPPFSHTVFSRSQQN